MQAPYPLPDPSTSPLENSARSLFVFVVTFLLVVNLVLLILPDRVRDWIFGKGKRG